MKTVQRNLTMLLYKRSPSHSQRWIHFFPSVDLALQLKIIPLNADDRLLEHMLKEDRILCLEEGFPHQYIQLWVESSLGRRSEPISLGASAAQMGPSGAMQ